MKLDRQAVTWCYLLSTVYCIRIAYKNRQRWGSGGAAGSPPRWIRSRQSTLHTSNVSLHWPIIYVAKNYSQHSQLFDTRNYKVQCHCIRVILACPHSTACRTPPRTPPRVRVSLSHAYRSGEKAAASGQKTDEQRSAAVSYGHQYCTRIAHQR